MTTTTLSRIGIPTGSWRVDKACTRVGFAAKQMGFSTVRGEFREFDGALEIGEHRADMRAYGRVAAASNDTNLPRRDKHLRSTDFFLPRAIPSCLSVEGDRTSGRGHLPRHGRPLDKRRDERGPAHR
jgi:polyisoprenoid-binding protein YceI